MSSYTTTTHKAMNNQRTLLFTFTLVVAAALTVAVTPAARAGVSTESPFAPRGFGPGGAASNSPIELRGITSDDQGMRFAIYDPAKKEGAWVRVDEKGQPYVVRSYDAGHNQIVVDYQGRSQTLALAEPKFGPSKTVPMMIPGMAPQSQANLPPRPDKATDRAGYEQWKQLRQQQQQGQSQQQAQPSPAENARLDAIRAEIARRRAGRTDGGGR